MADIVKLLKDIGKVYQDAPLKVFDSCDSRNISKIASYDVKSGELSIEDFDLSRNRNFLHLTSSNGGYLYPFFPYNDKFQANLKKAFSNMKEYASKSSVKKIEELENMLDTESLENILKSKNIPKMGGSGKKDGENVYFALLYDGKTMYEIFEEVAINYIDSVCDKSEIKKPDADSFFGEKREIGYDPELKFCSVNELPKPLQKIKYKILPLSKEEAFLVKIGYIQTFEKEMFRFSVFGLSYYLLPSIFFKDKRKIIQTIANMRQMDSDQQLIEKKLKRLLKKMDESGDIKQKLLFNFLFLEKNQSAVNLYQLIEDIAPSRIKRNFDLMEAMKIDDMRITKENFKNKLEDSVYIQEYIGDRLLLAKVFFGKEKVSKDFIISSVFKKMVYGYDRKDVKSPKTGDVIAYAKQSDFEKHQRLLDFIEAINGLRESMSNYLYKEIDMDRQLFSDIAKEKFESVGVLKPLKTREAYVLGALSRLVMNWQIQKNSGNDNPPLQKYLNSIGMISPQNMDRIFAKIYDSAGKYQIYGESYDDLIRLYTEIKESVSPSDRISVNEATIAFVMGSSDFKEFNQLRKKGEKDERNETE